MAAIGLVAFGAALFAAPASAAPPPNDDFANATVLGPGLPVAVNGTTQDATGEPGETSHTGIPVNPPPTGSVWYRWTPQSNFDDVVLDLCDNTSDPPSIFLNVAVYTGSTLATLGSPVVVGGGFTDGPGGCKMTFDATAGTTYRIAVDIPSSQGYGNFTLRLREPSPPANDDYANALVVGPALPVSVPATTIDATTQASEPAHLGGSIGRSVWFRWTAGASGPVRADACDWDLRSGDANTAIGVYTDTNSAFPVGATVAESSTCEADFNAVAGQEYRIAYSGPVAGEGNFTFRIRSTAPPSNDNFANALEVGPGLPVAVNAANDFATKQGGEPGHGGGDGQRSVWFRWTPTAAEAGTVAVNVCNDWDEFTPDLGIYTGTTLAALGPAVGTNPAGNSPYCYKLLNAVAGTTYRIAVSSSLQVGDEGAFVLDIHRPSPPANDAFETPTTVGPALPVAAPGTLVDATEQEAAGETTHASFNDPYHSVWYRWTAPATELVSVDVCDAPFYSAISVYTGNALNALDEVAQADDEGCGDDSPGSRTGFSALAGQTYLIAVDTLDPGHWGEFTLRINGPSGQPVQQPANPGPAVTPPPAKKPFNLKAAIKRCKKKFAVRSKLKKCIKKARKRARA